jgi:hypothetical protein
MVKHDWNPSTVTPGHLQKLVKHGFVVAIELKPCRVSEDPTFATHAKGYVVFFVAFYE